MKNKNLIKPLLLLAFFGVIIYYGYKFTRPIASDREIMLRSGFSNEEIKDVEDQPKNIEYAKRNAVSILKSSLKDPESYDEVDIKAFDDGSADSKIRIEITYRATNSYGAYIQNVKNFVFEKDGKTLNSTY